jgi:hypothetical protein
MSADLGMRVPIVAWKPAGTVDMYSATFDSNATNPSWSSPARIGLGDGGTNTSPTLSAGFAVWKGWGSSDYIYHTQAVTGGGFCFTTDMLVVWKGAGSDQHLYYTRGFFHA